MADLSVTPVATQIKPMPTMSLGEMINFARGAQEYQRGGITLAREQQEEAERKRVIEFMARPENFQSDGRIDINKLNAEIPKIAPLTGGELIRKYSDLSTAQTQAERAIQDMTTSQRELIGSSLSAYGYRGEKDPKAYQGLLDNIEAQYKNNPAMKSLVQSFRTQLGMVSDPSTLPQLAISAGNQVMNPAAQRTAFAPQPGSVSTGAATYPTVTLPSVAGEYPTVRVGEFPFATSQIGPGQRETIEGTDPVSNLPIVVTRSEDGTIIGRRLLQGEPRPEQLPGQYLPAPTGAARRPTDIYGRPLAAPPIMPVRGLPPGETTETLNAANQIRTRAQDAALTVPNQRFNNNEIVRLSEEALTGRGSGVLANLTGGYALFNAVGLGGGNATALNQLGHYMALQTATLAQSAGLGTDAARNLAAESTGTINWTPDAIKKTARVNRALATATELFNQGVQNEFRTSKGDPFSAREFQNRWSQTADINAIRLFDAMQNNDADGFREVVDSVGGPRSAEYNRLKQRIESMKRLVGM